MNPERLKELQDEFSEEAMRWTEKKEADKAKQYAAEQVATELSMRGVPDER